MYLRVYLADRYEEIPWDRIILMAALDLNELVMTVNTDVYDPPLCSDDGKSFYDLSSETRESGDGDSGTEYKEKPSPTNSDVEPPVQSVAVGTKPKKSRIPVRTPKCTKDSSSSSSSRAISGNFRTNDFQSKPSIMISDLADESALKRDTARAHQLPTTEDHQIIILEAPEQFRSLTNQIHAYERHIVVDADWSDTGVCRDPDSAVLEDSTTAAVGAEVTGLSQRDGHDNEQPDAVGTGTTSGFKSDDAMYRRREKSPNNGASTIAEGAVQVLQQGLATEDVSTTTITSNSVSKETTREDEDAASIDGLLSSVLSDNLKDCLKIKTSSAEVKEAAASLQMDLDLCKAPRARDDDLAQKTANNNVINVVNTTKIQQQKQQPVLGVISLLRQVEQDMAQQKHHFASCANNEINDLTDNVQYTNLPTYTFEAELNKMRQYNEVKCKEQQLYHSLNHDINNTDVHKNETEKSLLMQLHNNNENDIVLSFNLRRDACEKNRCESNKCLEETDVITCETRSISVNNAKSTATNSVSDYLSNNPSECALNKMKNYDNFHEFRNIMDLYVIQEECENKNSIEFSSITDCENCTSQSCFDVLNERKTLEILMNSESLVADNADNSNYKSVPLNHNELEFTNSICSDGYDNPSLGAQNDNLIDSVSIDNYIITKELQHQHYSSSNYSISGSNNQLECDIIGNDMEDSNSITYSNGNSNNNCDDISLRYGNNGVVGGSGLDSRTDAAILVCSDKVESGPFKDNGNVSVADDSCDAVVITAVTTGGTDTDADNSNGLYERGGHRDCDSSGHVSSAADSSAACVPSLSVAASIHSGAVDCAAVSPPLPPPSGCSSNSGSCDSRRSTDAWISRRCTADVLVQGDHTTVSTATTSSCWTIPTSAGQPSAPRALNPPLSFAFHNGRLVFDPVVQLTTTSDNKGDGDPGILHLVQKSTVTQQQQVTDYSDSTQSSANNTLLLSSKDLNKRPTDGRLKELGEKLKKAGLTDDNNQPQHKYTKYCSDKNQNLLANDSDYPTPHEYDDSVSVNTSCCEFDVSRISAYSFGDDRHFFEVYDELDDEETGDLSLEPTSAAMPSTAGEMDTIDRSKQHNPDHENLKSLLKKPGRTKDNANRAKKGVVFNEKKNEFFDADYIILIREDCDYDEEEDDGVCTCNQQHEMVRLACCEPNCNCGYSEGGPAATPQSPKFAPPLEFVDAVTLSPPEGYKDMGLEEQQLIALQQLARRGQLTAACGTTICRECSATHEIEEGEGSEEEISDNETAERMDHSQQTTPTTPPAEDDEEMTCDHSDHLHHHRTSPDQQQQQQQSATATTNTATLITTTSCANNQINSQQSTGTTVTAGNACGSPISGILKGGRLWKQQSSLEGLTGPAGMTGQGAGGNGVNNGVAETAASAAAKTAATQSDSSITSDDEAGGTNGRRSVRFIDSSDSFSSSHRESCDGASSESRPQKDEIGKLQHRDDCNNALMDTTELMLTFKLPNHHLQISNNSLKPNSAMRQLFPCTKVDEANSPYLVTAEALRAFDEAKRSKLQQILQDSNNISSSSDTDSIKRAIERNTLRRSLIKYEPKLKKAQQKSDNSLVERIKQLTCDIDEEVVDSSSSSNDVVDGDELQQQTRSSPPGEEARISPEVNNLMVKVGQGVDKSFSPSSSSTASSNSSVSSTYKKITDLFGKTKEKPDIQNNIIETSKPPDLCNSQQHSEFIEQSQHYAALAKANSTNEARKQFLSTLAPLTACVGGIAASEDYYYHLKNQTAGERVSIASSVGTEYSLEDIDEGLKKADEDETKRIAPDVLVGTPSASDSADELAMFVQQDASRIERIKKKYQPVTDDEDEHDDYGFNRRPSVRGIKPRFGSTTEILQQIQNQMQPPTSIQQPAATPLMMATAVTSGGTPPRQPNTTAATSWPYYSETASLSAASSVDGGSKNRNNVNQGVPVSNNYSQQPQYITTDDVTKRNYAHFRPTNVIDENVYQNCANQRCTQQQINYRPNVNIYAPTIKIGGDYYHQTTVSVPASAIVPPRRNSSPGGGSGRPLSPPPQEISKSHYQTMMYIPYNHIDAYQQQQAPQSPNFYNVDGYNRITNQNQINKRYIDPATAAAAAAVYQMRLDEPHYATKAGVTLQQQPAHRSLVVGRSESPLPAQYATARATQTAGVAATTMATSNMPQQQQHCTQQAHIDYSRAGYYTTTRYHHRPVSGSVSSISSEPTYVTKVNRHSFPASAIAPQTPPISAAHLQQQQIINGYIYSGGIKDTSIPNSPTKQQAHRFIERGVPEGAASVSPQDSTASASASQSASTMTSPIISPHQHPPPTVAQTAADLAAINNANNSGAPIPGAKPLFYAMNV